MTFQCFAFEATLASQIFGRQFKIPSSDKNLAYIPFNGIAKWISALDISSGDLREIPEVSGDKPATVCGGADSANGPSSMNIHRIFR